jgi:DNA-binding response OmpR family regulator
MTNVLLVEDDPAARQGLELALRRLGYGVRFAETGEAALDGICEATVDVVVLDVMLPGVDGFEVCRQLRRSSDVPVIMLTPRSDDFDIVGGLEAGADDYVVKPVEPRVLDARIRAVLRRMGRTGSPAETYAAVAACLRIRGWADVDTDIPAGLTMPLDRRRFDVILANLIGNALCHGRPPVTVQASIQPADGGEQLALLVRDHGVGIPPDALPHVFDRFYKADTARSRSEGSGLGPAIACENTRLHGGSIEAADHPGGGALFTLWLPVRRAEPAGLADGEPVTVARS